VLQLFYSGSLPYVRLFDKIRKTEKGVPDETATIQMDPEYSVTTVAFTAYHARRAHRAPLDHDDGAGYYAISQRGSKRKKKLGVDLLV
jgi:hypothetical protein